jgi:CRISPR-associated protein Csd1
MSWIQKLYDTYEKCDDAPQFATDPLMPMCHILQKAHIEVVIDVSGEFRSARVLQKNEQSTPVPCTEDSASRTSNDAPHALCDKIQYCASDYVQRGGRKEPYWESFSNQLKQWCSSPYAHPKARAVLDYLLGHKLLDDLAREKVLVVDDGGRLADTWDSDNPLPALFKLLLAKEGRRDQGDAILRWRVQVSGDPISKVWEDTDLQNCWVQYCASLHAKRGVDLVTGNSDVSLATKHPRGIRWPGDGAKLISSNDKKGFTFRGRFKSAEEACGVGFEISQKAHNALRWLIDRQGYRDKASGQVFVAWDVGGKQIPDPFKNTAELLGLPSDVPEESASDPEYGGDTGQYLALQLQKLIKGYQGKLTEADNIVVMGLDSASLGRLAITYYRELNGSEFFDRVIEWHESHAWPQRYSQEVHFVGAPAPREIAEAAYGRRLNDKSGAKLRAATVERLLPCIVDGRSVPRDIVESCVRRACNRIGAEEGEQRERQRHPKRGEEWNWEKSLGIACGLFRGFHRKEDYKMSLEEDRNSRDYLFGRLLAIADHLEGRALYVAGENRDTNASKLMQRFADRPSSTWRTIELALTPYKARLRAKRPGMLVAIEKQLDEITCKFQTSEFTDDGKLSGEFLLAYHCQRAALWANATKEQTPEDELIHEGDE